MADANRPAAFQDQEFVLKEGAVYRVLRTLSIWANKVFFSALFLLGVWLVVASVQGLEGCAETVHLEEGPNNTTVDAGLAEHCSVFLTETAKYLGSMVVLSLVVSILLGLAGLVVGRRLVQATPAQEEVGARGGDDAAQEGPGAGSDADGRGPS